MKLILHSVQQEHLLVVKLLLAELEWTLIKDIHGVTAWWWVPSSDLPDTAPWFGGTRRCDTGWEAFLDPKTAVRVPLYAGWLDNIVYYHSKQYIFVPWVCDNRIIQKVSCPVTALI